MDLGRSHNPEVAGSNPARATMKTRLIDGFFVYRHLELVGCNIAIMKRFLLLLVYIIILNSDLFASRPTFINIITNSDTIHHPTMTDVSETEITLDTGIVILIDDVNAVMAYGPTKRLPVLAGAACGYLGFCPGFIFASLLVGGTDEGGPLGLMIGLGTVALSGIFAYNTTHRIVREKNKKMVFMDGWSIEEKRNFFINAIP